MTPAARVQAAIEILDHVIASARDNGPAADTILADWFRQRRYAGSKDRRAIREHVYSVLRAFETPPESGRAAMIGLLGESPELFDDTGYGPSPIMQGEPVSYPGATMGWLADLVPEDMRASAFDRATLDIRINAARTTREEMLPRFDGAEPITTLPNGIRLPAGTAVEQHDAWQQGLVEIQDAGSQWIVEACRAGPDMTIVDLCAGAGGKTLALAAAMNGKGRLVACDTNRDRLSRLSPRAKRAGADMIETRLLDAGREPQMLADLKGMADLVLVDAPCSGSGTWRRNPETRWRLTPERLARVNETQAHVLALAAPLVKAGGRLVYAVCSVIDSEGTGQIETYLRNRPGWSAELLDLPVGQAHGLGRRLTPFHDETDGFFIASLARSC